MSFHTSRVMAGSQQDTTGGFAKTDDMRSGRGRENAILADEKLLDAIGSANLGNQLDDLGVPIPAIASNDKEGVC